VAIMLPKGYRYDFDLIVAQQHDNPPDRENIISLPINLAYAEPLGLVRPVPGRRYVSLIIGGDSKHARLDPEHLRRQIEQIFALFPQHDFWLTTSRRTSVVVENILRKYSFARAVYYSTEQINPIPDFLLHSEYVFLTADSTSMLSEAVSCGLACVEVMPSEHKRELSGKFGRMNTELQRINAVHIFEGESGTANRKIDLVTVLCEVVL